VFILPLANGANFLGHPVCGLFDTVDLVTPQEVLSACKNTAPAVPCILFFGGQGTPDLNIAGKFGWLNKNGE